MTKKKKVPTTRLSKTFVAKSKCKDRFSNNWLRKSINLNSCIRNSLINITKTKAIRILMDLYFRALQTLYPIKVANNNPKKPSVVIIGTFGIR